MTGRLGLRIDTLTGRDIGPVLPELARLRITVFREWPYLYDGDEDRELAHLQVYAKSSAAAIVVARDGERVVGASTCLPLVDGSDTVTAPFRDRGWALDQFFYFGESVLLPAWRGRGAGVAFFGAREAHARRLSRACEFACFCAVVRPPDHPARPPGWTPLDAFWRRRGYTPRPDLVTTTSWKEIGQAEETAQTLQFWLKALGGAPLP